MWIINSEKQPKKKKGKRKMEDEERLGRSAKKVVAKLWFSPLWPFSSWTVVLKGLHAVCWKNVIGLKFFTSWSNIFIKYTFISISTCWYTNAKLLQICSLVKVQALNDSSLKSVWLIYNQCEKDHRVKLCLWSCWISLKGLFPHLKHCIPWGEAKENSRDPSSHPFLFISSIYPKGNN